MHLQPETGFREEKRRSEITTKWRSLDVVWKDVGESLGTMGTFPSVANVLLAPVCSVSIITRTRGRGIMVCRHVCLSSVLCPFEGYTYP